MTVCPSLIVIVLTIFRNSLLGYPDLLPQKRKKYYNVKKEEYFFDRNQEAFHAILYYYQSKGSLYIPPSVQEHVFYQVEFRTIFVLFVSRMFYLSL